LRTFWAAASVSPTPWAGFVSVSVASVMITPWD
jgi:hypothetical protein